MVKVISSLRRSKLLKPPFFTFGCCKKAHDLSQTLSYVSIGSLAWHIRCTDISMLHQKEKSGSWDKAFKILVLASKKYRRGEADAISIVKATKVFNLMRSIRLLTTEPLEILSPLLARIWANTCFLISQLDSCNRWEYFFLEKGTTTSRDNCNRWEDKKSATTSHCLPLSPIYSSF